MSTTQPFYLIRGCSGVGDAQHLWDVCIQLTPEDAERILTICIEQMTALFAASQVITLRPASADPASRYGRSFPPVDLYDRNAKFDEPILYGIIPLSDVSAPYPKIEWRTIQTPPFPTGVSLPTVLGPDRVLDAAERAFLMRYNEVEEPVILTYEDLRARMFETPGTTPPRYERTTQSQPVTRMCRLCVHAIALHVEGGCTECTCDLDIQLADEYSRARGPTLARIERIIREYRDRRLFDPERVYVAACYFKDGRVEHHAIRCENGVPIDIWGVRKFPPAVNDFSMSIDMRTMSGTDHYFSRCVYVYPRSVERGAFIGPQRPYVYYEDPSMASRDREGNSYIVPG